MILHSNNAGKIELKINLIAPTWGTLNSDTVQCFINGKFFGNIDKTRISFIFIIGTNEGINEISFRSRKPWRSDLNILNYNWLRMQLPIQSLSATRI